MTPDRIAAYLRRIGLDRAPKVTPEGLATLIEAHLLTVPFENLDITLGRGIDLDRAHLFEKIVRQRRGGYCFELNGLFGDLLDALGFERRPVMARVWYRDPPETPPLTHTLNLVRFGGEEWMADVGFGGTTARVPMLLKDGATAADIDGDVRVIPKVGFGLLLQRKKPEGWENQFSTTGETAHLADQIIGNHYTSTHPASHFTHAPLAGKFTLQGRDTLVGRTLNIRRGFDIETSTLDDTAVRHSLRTRFGLNLGKDEDALVQTVST